MSDVTAPHNSIIALAFPDRYSIAFWLGLSMGCTIGLLGGLGSGFLAGGTFVMGAEVGKADAKAPPVCECRCAPAPSASPAAGSAGLLPERG